VVGTGIGILFLAFGAPDLAMTQLLTELLTIILAVLVIHRLPKFRSLSSIPTRIRDGVIAISFGLSMMLLVLVVQNADRSDHVMRYFANNAVEKAYGSNVVNTILVDFRAMDTLGEIVVLAVAALGVYALMNLRIGREEE
jgi:multicomponent Na+:H+ antiporter subunit A